LDRAFGQYGAFKGFLATESVRGQRPLSWIQNRRP